MIESGNKFTDLLFVYGILRKGTNNEMALFLEKNSTYVGKGTVKGIMYDLEGYPALVEDEEKGFEIVGDIYQIHDIVNILDELDKFEELGPGFDYPNKYTRDKITVHFKNAQLKCWIYLANDLDTSKYAMIDTGDYLEYYLSKKN